MDLREKMISPRPPICDIRSVCKRQADKAYAADLFERPWNDLVIRAEGDGKFRMYTECCGRLTPA